DLNAMLSLLKRAGDIWGKSFGMEHPYYALALSNQAEALRNLSRFDEALALDERALVIREKSLGREHPDLAMTLLGMAEAHVEMGRFALALPPAERALGLCLKNASAI